MTMKLWQLVSIGALFFINALFVHQAIDKTPPFMDVDSQAYVNWGSFFARDTSFAACKKLPAHSLGYAVFVGLIYKIAGNNPVWVVYVQMLLGMLMCMLVAVCAALLFGNGVGMIAGLLAACNIGFITFSQFILTDLVLAFLLLAGTCSAAYALRFKRPWVMVLASFILGLSIVIKPAALYYPVLFIPLVYALARHVPMWSRIKVCSVALFLFYLPLAGVLVHNQYVFNECKLGNLQEVNLYFWLLPNILAEANHTSSDTERVALQAQVVVAGSYEPAATTLKFFIKKRPGIVVFVVVKNIAKTLLGLFSTNLKVLVEPAVNGGMLSFFKIKGSLVAQVKAYLVGGVTKRWVGVVSSAEAVWTPIRLLLVLVALLVLFMHKNYYVLYLATAHCAYFSVITLHDGCARFRMMFEFWLIILTALSLWILVTSWLPVFRFKER